jgi:hypothetical protein
VVDVSGARKETVRTYPFVLFDVAVFVEALWQDDTGCYDGEGGFGEEVLDELVCVSRFKKRADVLE